MFTSRQHRRREVRLRQHNQRRLRERARVSVCPLSVGEERRGLCQRCQRGYRRGAWVGGRGVSYKLRQTNAEEKKRHEEDRIYHERPNKIIT